MTTALNVTIVAHDIGPVGGMERQLTELISGLLAAGHHVHVIARSCAVDPHPNLRWTRIPSPRRPFALYFPWFFLASAIACRRHGRDLVHSTGAITAARSDLATVHFCHHAFGLDAARQRSSKTSWTYQLNAVAAATISRVAERWAYRPRRVGALVPVSAGVSDELRRWFPAMSGTTRIIPNGVDRARFRPNSSARATTRDELGCADDDLLALFVGGEWERKGLRYAIEALPTAPEWQLVVAGPGDQGRYLALAERLGVADRVRLLGRREDTPALYAASDAFVLPTEYEAFPLVVLEAAAAGLPLLTTAVNGATELVVEGETGWIIQRNAAVISDRLSRLAADDALRRRLGAEARRRTTSLSWEAVVEDYISLYRELAANSRIASTTRSGYA